MTAFSSKSSTEGQRVDPQSWQSTCWSVFWQNTVHKNATVAWSTVCECVWMWVSLSRWHFVWQPMYGCVWRMTCLFIRNLTSRKEWKCTINALHLNKMSIYHAGSNEICQYYSDNNWKADRFPYQNRVTCLQILHSCAVNFPQRLLMTCTRSQQWHHCGLTHSPPPILTPDPSLNISKLEVRAATWLKENPSFY